MNNHVVKHCKELMLSVDPIINLNTPAISTYITLFLFDFTHTSYDNTSVNQILQKIKPNPYQKYQFLNMRNQD